jgi:hypothetical protein
MTNHSIMREGAQALCAALLASAICAAWPVTAQAKGSFKRASTTSGTSGNVSGKWNTTHTSAAKIKTTSPRTNSGTHAPAN